MKGNVAVFDECKGSNGTLFCFAGIVFRDEETYEKVKKEIEKCKSKFPQLSKGEIKSKGLHAGNTELIKYLTACFNYILSLAEQGYLRIQFYFMYGKDVFYSTIDLKQTVIKLFKETTSLQDDTSIIKNSYFQLDCFLIKYLDKLPFTEDYVKIVFSDDYAQLAQENDKVIQTHGNIASCNVSNENLNAMEIENLHNSLNKMINGNGYHKGLESIAFLDSKDNVVVQLCDFLASCIFNSVVYLYCEENGIDSSNYKFKHDFICSFIPGVDDIDIDSMNLSYDSNAIKCTSKFENISGIVSI